MPNQALDTPTKVYKGPVTHNHAKLLQQEVHAFLSGLHPNIDENYILPEYMSPNVTQVYTRGYTTGLHEGRRGLRHGHKGCFPSWEGLRAKTQGYIAEASTSGAKQYHLMKRRDS